MVVATTSHQPPPRSATTTTTNHPSPKSFSPLPLGGPNMRDAFTPEKRLQNLSNDSCGLIKLGPFFWVGKRSAFLGPTRVWPKNGDSKRSQATVGLSCIAVRVFGDQNLTQEWWPKLSPCQQPLDINWIPVFGLESGPHFRGTLRTKLYKNNKESRKAIT